MPVDNVKFVKCKISGLCAISACAFGALGISKLSGFIEPEIENYKLKELDFLNATSCPILIAYFPNEALSLLKLLEPISKYLTRNSTPKSLLIISHCPANWLFDTLLNLVKEPNYLSQVRAVSSGLKIHDFNSLIPKFSFSSYPKLMSQAQQELYLIGGGHEGLTQFELRAMIGYLHGQNVRFQAKCRGVNCKTIYTQRSSGIKKLINSFPQYADFFPGIKKRMNLKPFFKKTSKYENEFIHGVFSKDVFPVFQPITDSQLNLQGLEILSRWKKNGEILYPENFLTQIKSEYAWLVLTIFLVQEAIQLINRYQARFNVSINIPPILAGSEHLFRVLKAARSQLIQTDWTKCITLEISEKTDMHSSKTILENLYALRQYGFKVMLDDCFSSDSVLFPVRTISFDGYKLDSTIVKDFQYDAQASALIKTMIHFCQLTNAHCIAEGIDSVDKLNHLSAMGIRSFQGFLISRPVTYESLDALILKLSNRN